jgi:predicted phage terminase large subunit-like protein
MEITNEKKLAVLGKIFEQNIEEFGRFFFPNHLSAEIPDFHKEIYRLLEADYKRLAIGAPRGFAKSTLLSLVFLAWLICMKKAHFVLIVSDTYAQSVLFLDALKAELESNDKLQAFYGKMTSSHWSEGEIITNGIMVKAVGAGMKVRGLKYRNFRPDYILVDDIENEELTNSAERRNKLERWFNGALVPSLNRDGAVIVVGTILHFEALLAKLLDKKQYTEYTKKTYRATKDWKTTIWEEHMNIKRLLEIKEEYIEKGQISLFYSEYMNQPVTAEFQKFKYEDLKFYKEAELDRKLLNSYFFIDRAYSLAKTADFTGLVIVSVDRDNNWYVRIAERFKGREGELIDKIFYYARKFKTKIVGVEQKAFTNTFEPILNEEMRKRDFFFNTEEVKSLKESKENRIEGLVPRYENGSIFLLREHTDLIDEMMQFPKAPHDDILDALSFGLRIIKRPMNRGSGGIAMPKASYA